MIEIMIVCIYAKQNEITDCVFKPSPYKKYPAILQGIKPST